MQREEAAGQVVVSRDRPVEANGRVAVSTHDRGEATSLLRRAYPHIALEIGGGDGPFVFRHSSIGDGRIWSTELMMSGPARATGTFEEDTVAVGEVLAGRLSADAGRTRIDPAQPFLRPSGPTRMTLDDVHLRMTAFDADLFHQAAERYDREGERRRLSRSAPTSPAAAAAWTWTAAHVQRTMRDPHTLDNPIVAGELFDLAVRTVLSCFAEQAADAGTGVAASPKAVRRAVAYLEEHALDVVTVPEVAAAARISVRSLQALFRRHLGVSPVEHLHAIRLEAARRDLLAGASGEDATVRAVAERWGFGNSGRFARLYQERFGERPSDTLRSHR